MYVTTDKEKKEAYRLRYQIYCEAMELESPYSDHELRELQDPASVHADL